jgi:hypothetical protein
VLSVAPAGRITAPSALDFRMTGRAGQLFDLLPGMLLRGLVLGVVLGCASGFAAYCPALPRHLLVQDVTLIAAAIGLVCGIGGAVVRWARTPADTEHNSPRSTLVGDRGWRCRPWP